MKTIFKSIIALMAAMAATAVLPSCQKVLDEPGSSGVTQFYVGEVEDLVDEDAPDPEGVETKTVFGTPSGKSFPVLWTSGSFVNIICTGDDALEVSRTWAVYPSKDRKTASIRGDKLDLTGETGLSFIMVSPQDCFVSHTLYQPMKVKILTTQTPVTDGNGSPDEKTMILVAKTQTYATAPETVKFSPKHMTAYILLSLTNVSSIGKLQSVTVSSPTEYLSGPGTIDYSGTFPVLAPTSQASKSVTANVTSPTAVWLSCYPAKSKTLTIKATGSAGSLTRTINVPTGKALKAGVISGLTVDMNRHGDSIQCGGQERDLVLLQHHRCDRLLLRRRHSQEGRNHDHYRNDRRRRQDRHLRGYCVQGRQERLRNLHAGRRGAALR